MTKFFVATTLMSILTASSAFSSSCRISADVGEVQFFSSRSETENWCNKRYNFFGANSGCFFRKHYNGKWEGNFAYHRSFDNLYDYRNWHNNRRGHRISFSGNCY